MNEDLKLCEKKRYESPTEALMMIDRLVSRGQVDIGELRYYKCHICHNFHLTSTRK